MNFYVCICFLAVINKKLHVAQSSTSTFTKSPEEGAVVTTESDVSQSAAQQEVASSIESEQTSAVPIPEEPVFILSLTEIPPTGFRTEPLPLTPVSELHSHGQRYACFKLLSDAVKHTDTMLHLINKYIVRCCENVLVSPSGQFVSQMNAYLSLFCKTGSQCSQVSQCLNQISFTYLQMSFLLYLLFFPHTFCLISVLMRAERYLTF